MPDRRFGDATALDAHGMAHLNDMFQAFRAAGVFLDTIDIYGLRIEGGSFVNNTTTLPLTSMSR